MEKYAVMIQTRLNRWNLDKKWVTYLVCDNLLDARKEQSRYEASQHLLPGHNTTVVVYHSHEWENLLL